jgi:lipid-binding SYLF domain-containing protein
MKIGKGISLAMIVLLLVGVWSTAASAKASGTKEVQNSANVLQEIMRIPEKGIPPVLLRDAHAIIIIPGLIKGAFMVGGEHGTGVLLSHENGRWSDPVFVSISAGSFGWQIGGSSTDLILVFKGEKGVEGLLKGKVTLGADASVAAGPVGRSAEAATDVMLKSGILSYSRSKGLFAGLSLEGAVLLIDNDADAAYYGKNISASEILAGNAGKKAPATKRLQQLLNKYSEVR